MRRPCARPIRSIDGRRRSAALPGTARVTTGRKCAVTPRMRSFSRPALSKAEAAKLDAAIAANLRELGYGG